jgi:muramidase (phage lysozyme)
MDKTVPVAAGYLLEYIYKGESNGNYDCISSNKQDKLPKRITKMTLAEILPEMQTWRKKYGTLSSAAGAPQFIYKTLDGLVDELKLPLKTVFTADLQDRLAYHLLRRRGYDAYVFGRISKEEFAKRLAQEWASLPVLAGTKNYRGVDIKRGTSFYAGDGLNSSKHVDANAFEGVLDHVLELHKQTPEAPVVKPTKTTEKVATGAAVGAGTVVAVGTAVQQANDAVTNLGPVMDTVTTLGKYGPTVVAVGVAAVFVAVIGVWLYRKWKAKE